ncbi:MAG: transcriptional regulator [Propionibacteriaceae bacterium]|jgi:DNA-binding transcriptional regulator LsrR (DeoR family)|nr:transcriptional regulator [Propionibacteriaceae bacterium]
MNVVNQKYEEMYQAATRYYIQGETMESISHQLQLSRSSVSRLLKEARKTGLVRISIADQIGSQSPIATRLADLFGVRVHIAWVRENANEDFRLDAVSRLAGKILTDAVDDHQMIGVAWGVTLSAVVKHLGNRPLVGSTVVQINGGGNQFSSGIPYVGEIMNAISDAYDCKVVLFPTPAFFDHEETREWMWQESSVKVLLDMHKQLDLAVFGVGSLGAKIPSRVYSGGYLDHETIIALQKDGVVGDICTVLLRQDGSYQDIALNRRATGMTPAELRQIPRRLCVVADPSRAPAVLGALRAGVATDLILDEGTARAVLRLAK